MKMKNKVILAVVPLLTIILILLKSIPVIKQQIYIYETSKLTPINSITARTNKTIFIGRKTCPSCQKFMLSNFFDNKLSKKTYYMNTEMLNSKNKINLILKCKITTVPSLVKIKSGKIISVKHNYSELR
ncbi:hypothetical protein RD055328_12650 [Companilactobacillus sp. RD055328]|nr:hypothetical protein RD055328_12650 [Companilactobacillus sp. RD055328]